MGKKKTQQTQGKVEAVAVVSVNDEKEEEVYEEDELELLQVDLGDMIKLKQILDEAVAAAVLEKLDEDYRLDNFKLAIMIGACLFAVVAQFAPIPFPEWRCLSLLHVVCNESFRLWHAVFLVSTCRAP